MCLCDVALLALIALYCVVVLLVDLTVWPGRTPTILLALPIIVAALSKPPPFVMGTALVAVVVDALDIAQEHPPLPFWGVTLLALIGIGIVATLIALRRQEAIERSQRHEALIRAVDGLRQPLTVVVGYAQMLRAHPDQPDSFVVPLEKIELAAQDLKRQLDLLLTENRSSSV